LGLAAFAAHEEIPAYVALLRSDPSSFVRYFERANRLANYEPANRHFAQCNPQQLAILLRANEKMGPLPIPKCQGIPQNLDVEGYWRS
jgi:hypothetical protein